MGLVVVVGGAGTARIHHQMKENLPQLEGEVDVTGLEAAVTVQRDALGVPRLVGENRRDIAQATGFVHAQDRFFQMDLLRRRAAGELSELMGGIAAESDRSLRIHRLRPWAQQVLAASSPQIRELLDAYTLGVNQALAQRAEPFEYTALWSDPRPWQPEDSILVLLSMFSRTRDPGGDWERMVALMYDTLPADLVRFLLPAGTEWDAPLLGEVLEAPPIPGPEVYDLRQIARVAKGPSDPAAALAPSAARAASNSWAVAGSLTSDGGALLADEIHLDLPLPSYFYRAAFAWTDAEGTAREVVGATLPGAPLMVVGSNGAVAWGITNSVIDTTDLILLEADPNDSDAYLTPDGPRPLERFQENVIIRGSDPETLTVEQTIWGPVSHRDTQGRRVVVRTTMNEPGAVNLEIIQMETVSDLDGALSAAHASGIPAMNFTAVDSTGRIGWTLIGKIPRRIGFDGHLPTTWSDGSRRWDGLLASEEVPRVVDPESGRLWTANNRLVDGEMLRLLGDGGYQLGARGRQIRDRLFALDQPTVEGMRQIQLDDEALFLRRWRDHLLEVLTPDVTSDDAQRTEFRHLVEHWGGHASVDSAGYRMVRSYRILLGQQVFGALTAECEHADPEFDYFSNFLQSEGPLWHLVSERPVHLLDPVHDDWNAQFLAGVDAVIALFAPAGPLAERTWGERNTADIGHPFTLALSPLDRFLSMPAEPLPGSDYMPRVQDPNYGASLRMVVSPGRESEGYFHMPGGQSGNPLSPHYGDGHAAWVAGEATPFLPGPPVHQLRLLPAKGPNA